MKPAEAAAGKLLGSSFILGLMLSVVQKKTYYRMEGPTTKGLENISFY